jgi:hypothetical protein
MIRGVGTGFRLREARSCLREAEAASLRLRAGRSAGEGKVGKYQAQTKS